MLGRYMLPLVLSFRPSLFGYCLLTSFLVLFQFARGELQKSCTRTAMNAASESCQLACPCRSYPPLPPPPLPPPLPKIIIHRDPLVPSVESWWKETVVLGLVGCASLVFLLLVSIIGYKAIKRKPLRKEQNGTSEFAMSSRSVKSMAANNAGV